MRVLTLIPAKPSLHPTLKERLTFLSGRLPSANPGLEMMTVLDWRSEPSQGSDCRPWSKVARVRNNLLDLVRWTDFDYILWIDADVVDYPADLPTRLIQVAHGGIAAPLVLVEESNIFYDWAAFIQHGRSHIEPTLVARIKGRNLDHPFPYWDYEPVTETVEMDSVGCVYVVHTDVYRSGARHEDHPAFTDHFPICEAARRIGRSVFAHRGVIAYHANLPKYGEAWH